jgi:hypothetical protein
MSDVIQHPCARDQRREIRKQWPAEFNAGLNFGLSGKAEFPSDPGGYPKGFHAWPLQRRNAWFAGFNFGYLARCEAYPNEKI